MSLRLPILLALLAVPVVAMADPVTDAPGGTRPPPDRISNLVVYGDDPCPKGQGDEIVVCARRPENERYRLPKRFREKPPTVAQGSWTNRAMDLDRASSAVLPNSCNPVGSNGQSGCYSQWLAQSRAERKYDKAQADAIP